MHLITLQDGNCGKIRPGLGISSTSGHGNPMTRRLDHGRQFARSLPVLLICMQTLVTRIKYRYNHSAMLPWAAVLLGSWAQHVLHPGMTRPSRNSRHAWADMGRPIHRECSPMVSRLTTRCNLTVPGPARFSMNTSPVDTPGLDA
jgi:hypothetical protein